jgi:hypothetical protein
MANFLVRIELHEAGWNDYETLHAEMADRGFSRKIKGDSGRTYQLPTAEYAIHTILGLASVRDLAAAAAKTTGRTFGVIVAEYSQSSWVGLAHA